VLLGTSALQAQSMTGGPMRIVVIVDSSAAVSPMLTQFRAGLNSFLDALPGNPEIAIVSTGGQLRIRVAPTSDRQKLHAAANRFAADGGPNTILDTLIEADKRFLKSAADQRSVFVILTTDQGANSSTEVRMELYQKFLADFMARQGRTYAIVISGGISVGPTSQISVNLAHNTGGLYQIVPSANGLVAMMKTLAERIAADQ
jgi:hypothetical protein